MSIGDQYIPEINKLILRSLSVQPNSKTAVVRFDNLKQHSGYIQWNFEKNLKKEVIFDDYNYDDTKRNTKSNVMINGDDDNLILTYQNCLTTREKLAENKKIHDMGQQLNREICYKLYELIRQNKDKYQAEICELAGFGKDVMNDNNQVCVTWLNMMVEQKILKKYKKDNHVYYECIENKLYEPFPYYESVATNSKLEAQFAEILKKYDINFEQQKIIPECVYKKPLRFDFCVYYLDCEVYVELDGPQHFEWIPFFHKTEKEFRQQQKRDKIKNEYMKDNDILFLRIRYDEDMEEKFTNFVSKL